MRFTHSPEQVLVWVFKQIPAWTCFMEAVSWSDRISRIDAVFFLSSQCSFCSAWPCWFKAGCCCGAFMVPQNDRVQICAAQLHSLFFAFFFIIPGARASFRSHHNLFIFTFCTLWFVGCKVFFVLRLCSGEYVLYPLLLLILISWKDFWPEW